MFAIASVDPALPAPGELLERMIGPWIDQTTLNSFRLSPLVSNSGQKVLAPGDVVRLNFTCAEHLTSQKSLDASKFENIFLHSLLGKNGGALTKLTMASLRSSFDTLARIAKVCTFTSVAQDNPIYPDDPVVSVQLRTVQVLMCLSVRNTASGAIWARLQSEFQTLGPSKQLSLKCLALSKMMLSPGAADLIPDVASLLVDLHALCAEKGALSSIPSEGGDRSIAVVSMLFCFQLMEARTMSGLFGLLNGFCDLPSEQRAILSDAFDQPGFDISTGVKSAWARAEKQADFDAQAALDSYLAVAERLASLGSDEMAQAAFEAAAATADEYLKDSRGALTILLRGVELFGKTHGLERARARVLLHAGQLEEFLQLAEPFMTDMEHEDAVGRAYFSRDVGIARAKRGDWPSAAEAFSLGEDATNGAKIRNLRLMGIGFAADVAVAQWKSGNKSAAVQTMDRTLGRLEAIEPAAGFREMALYRLVGNSMNYFFMNTGETRKLAPEIEVLVLAGCNSNPSPHEGLKDGPRGHMDVLWHMLADVEVQVGAERTIADRILSRPEEQRLLTFGPMLVWKRWQAGLASRNVTDLVAQAEVVLDAVWFIQNRNDVVKTDNGENPLRGPIPTVNAEQLARARSYIEDDILALATWLFLDGRTNDGISLLNGLANSPRSTLGPEVRDAILIEKYVIQSAMPSLADCCGFIRRSTVGTEPLTFEHLFVVGLRYLEVSTAPWRTYIVSPVLAWSASKWAGLSLAESYRLREPSRAVPAIQSALMALPAGRAGLASLLVAVLPFVPFQIEPEIAESLAQLANERVG